MPRVFLGIGHGGADSGAAAYGLLEKDINLVMGLACKHELEQYGVTVGISRIRDEADKLDEEIAECNAFVPDLAVEIHNNAGGGDGFEVFVQTNTYAAKSKALGQAIEAEVKALGQNSRGVKIRLSGAVDYYGWLRGVKAPAVLCEGAFLDSKDRFIIDTIPEQEAFGVAYARGILKVLGITEKPATNSKLTAERDAAIVRAETAEDKLAKIKLAGGW